MFVHTNPWSRICWQLCQPHSLRKQRGRKLLLPHRNKTTVKTLYRSLLFLLVVCKPQSQLEKKKRSNFRKQRKSKMKIWCTFSFWDVEKWVKSAINVWRATLNWKLFSLFWLIQSNESSLSFSLWWSVGGKFFDTWVKRGSYYLVEFWVSTVFLL